MRVKEPSLKDEHRATDRHEQAQRYRAQAGLYALIGCILKLHVIAIAEDMQDDFNRNLNAAAGLHSALDSAAEIKAYERFEKKKNRLSADEMINVQHARLVGAGPKLEFGMGEPVPTVAFEVELEPGEKIMEKYYGDGQITDDYEASVEAYMPQFNATYQLDGKEHTAYVSSPRFEITGSNESRKTSDSQYRYRLNDVTSRTTYNVYVPVLSDYQENQDITLNLGDQDTEDDAEIFGGYVATQQTQKSQEVTIIHLGHHDLATAQLAKEDGQIKLRGRRGLPIE